MTARFSSPAATILTLIRASTAPLAVRIEFGERGHETVIREVQEELDAEVTNVRYLGLLENIFAYQGAAGHEIVLIYDGRFTDPKYNQGDARNTRQR